MYTYLCKYAHVGSAGNYVQSVLSFYLYMGTAILTQDIVLGFKFPYPFSYLNSSRKTFLNSDRIFTFST